MTTKLLLCWDHCLPCQVTVSLILSARTSKWLDCLSSLVLYLDGKQRARISVLCYTVLWALGPKLGFLKHYWNTTTTIQMMMIQSLQAIMKEVFSSSLRNLLWTVIKNSFHICSPLLSPGSSYYILTNNIVVNKYVLKKVQGVTIAFIIVYHTWWTPKEILKYIFLFIGVICDFLTNTYLLCPHRQKNIGQPHPWLHALIFVS